MKNTNNNCARKMLRYNRRDIDIDIFQSIGNYKHVDLLNISQQGIAIRSSFRLKLNMEIISNIKFPEGHEFRESGHIVRKINPVDTNTRSSWLRSKSVYEYGVEFNDVSQEFKDTLLTSNIQLRLIHSGF
ncbi:MAG: hypothetical protein GQ581_05515 [Methyloprofundus sp.]|nr:hypothetical protein [Methyloprofundus sp.]